MSSRHELVRHVRARPGHVWRILTDVERWPDWTASVREVELRDDVLTVGSRVRLRQPRIGTATWTVTALEPGRRLTWVSRRPGVEAIADHRIDPVTADAVRVTLSVDYRGPLAAVVARLARRLTLRYLRLEAEGLARASEAESSA